MGNLVQYNNNYFSVNGNSNVPSFFTIDDLYESVTQYQNFEGCRSAVRTLFTRLYDPSCSCVSKYCNEFYNSCEKLRYLFSRKIWCIGEDQQSKMMNDQIEIQMAQKLLGISNPEQYTKENVNQVCRRLLAQNHPDKTRKPVDENWFRIHDACSLVKEDITNRPTNIFSRFYSWIFE